MICDSQFPFKDLRQTLDFEKCILSENQALYELIVSDTFLMISAVIPHTKGSQIGIRKRGFEYAHAPP